MQPKQLIVKNGRIVGIELYKMEINDDGNYHIDEGTYIYLCSDNRHSFFYATLTMINLDWGFYQTNLFVSSATL